jgi:hypothetical protein
MRELLYICFVFIYFPLIGLSQRARNIEGKGYQGYIFSEHNNALVGIEDQVSKFTPDLATVKIFEDKLCESMETLLHDVSEPNAGCPNIQRKLKKYVRQYFGFVNSEGRRILYVNFLWYKNARVFIKQIDNEYIQVSDGCTFYWNVKYDIENNRFYDFRVNSES